MSDENDSDYEVVDDITREECIQKYVKAKYDLDEKKLWLELHFCKYKIGDVFLSTSPFSGFTSKFVITSIVLSDYSKERDLISFMVFAKRIHTSSNQMELRAVPFSVDENTILDVIEHMDIPA